MMRTTRDVHSMSVPQTLSGPMPSVHRGEEAESKKGKRASRKNWHPHSVSLTLLRWGGGAFSLLSVVLDYNTAKNSRKDLDFPQKTWISVPTASLTV